MKEIAENLKTLIQEMRPDADVFLTETRKNNGVILTGITIKANGENTAPTVYIEPFVDDIESGNLTIEEAATTINVCVERNRTSEFDNVMSLLNKENIYQNVQFKLVNTEKNKEFLTTVPHDEFLDLSLIYVMVVQVKKTGIAFITLKNDLIEQLGIDPAGLKEIAIKNTQDKQKYSIDNMSSIFERIKDSIPHDMRWMLDIPHDECVPMYVLSSSYNGCNAMLDQKSLEHVSKLVGGDVYIMPSSIHEVIAVPVEGLDADTAREMVKEVNASELPVADVLSDNVYIYSSTTHELRMA